MGSVMHLMPAVAIGLTIALAGPTSEHRASAQSDQPSTMMGHQMMAPGLMMPLMDPARGRKLFASKGCVVCHSVNGIGGTDAASMDVSTMEPMMNPFEFAARMWLGAEPMIMMQREELGEQIELTGEELADIIAFTHHPEEQRKFSEADIPHRIVDLMQHLHKEGGLHEHEAEGGTGEDPAQE
jgi:cytochrome c